MRSLVRHAPAAWALVLALLLLGPALGAGYLLRYDMVWVPDLALRPDFWGLGSGLPRAVPSDAVVAVVDEVVPGMLLQKVVLLGSLVGAGVGSLRLVGPGAVARLTAVSLTVWNPYVVERLWLGHWTLLVGYGVLPWLVHAAARARQEGRVPSSLLVLLPLGCLSASAGVVSAVAVLVVGIRGRRPIRTDLALLAAVVAGNAPWVVAGLAHADIAELAASTRLFGLHGDGLPAPLTALSLGGVWNAQVVPGTRTAVLLPLVATVAVLAALALGARPLVRRVGTRTAGGLAACWVVGYVLALLTWIAPGAVDTLAGAVPGAGLLRDGGRWLALCVPLLAAAAGDAAERVVAATRDRAGQAAVPVVVAVAAVLLPVAVLPDAAWGVSGELRPAHFPSDWAAARTAVAARSGPGDLLVLPLGAYRAPPWNGGATVLDPLGRYLPDDYVADDRLVVSGHVLPGEDPRIPRVVAALGRSGSAARLRALGIGLVALEKDAPGAGTGPVPPGTTVFDGPTLRVVRLDGPVADRQVGAVWRWSLGLAWTAFAGLLLLGFSRGVRDLLTNGVRRRRGW